MGIRYLWVWMALVMMFTVMACLYVSPSYACACAGENPDGSLTGWLFVGMGAFIFCGLFIVTLLLTVRIWTHRRRQ